MQSAIIVICATSITTIGRLISRLKEPMLNMLVDRLTFTLIGTVHRFLFFFSSS